MTTSSFLDLPSGTQLNIESSSAQFPAWYQKYQQAILSRGNAIASKDYSPYPGARQEGFSNEQENAWEQLASGLGGLPWFTQSGSNILEGVAGEAASNASNPYFDYALGQQSAEVLGPYAQNAAEVNVADNILGGIQNAGQGFNENASSYLNPAKDRYLADTGTLLNRNLNENILPGINSTFTGAGQFGSSRQSDFMGRAVRDTQEALGREATRFEAEQYGTAGQLYGADAARRLQGAGLYGSTLASDADRQLGAGQALAGASAQDSALGAQIGTSAAQIGAADLNRQADVGSRLGDMGSSYLQQLLGGSGALEQIGQQRQDFGQEGLDLGYQDFLQQRDYPLRQMQIMQSLMSGQPIPGISTTSYSSEPGSSTSPLAALAALGITGAQYGAFGGTTPA